MKSIFYITVFLFYSGISFSQKKPVQFNHKKGTVITFWGWNTAAYSKSDMRFRGNDYDFTLYNVKAQDLPKRPFREPQNNYGLGYFFKDNWALIASFDHMKYVMEQNQTVRMKGFITRNGPFKGDYDGDKTLTTDFLQFDHTDGLNYINVELEKYYSWYTSKNNKFMLSGMLGGGIGILNPRTDIYLMDYDNSNRYHISGFGIDLKAAAQVTFFKHVFGKVENKFGYINMPDIPVYTNGITGKIKHAFFFSEMVWMIGANFSITGSKNKNSTGTNY